MEDVEAIHRAYLTPAHKRKGKGGRQPAADPRLDPGIDPKRARRILANRLSAARSKMKQKSHVEVRPLPLQCPQAALVKQPGWHHLQQTGVHDEQRSLVSPRVMFGLKPSSGGMSCFVLVQQYCLTSGILLQEVICPRGCDVWEDARSGGVEAFDERTDEGALMRAGAAA